MKNEYEGLTAEETAMVKGIKKTCPDCGAVNTLQWNDGLKASICGDCATIEAQQSNSVRHGDLIKRLNRRCRGGWVFKAAREGSALAQDFGRFYARVTHTGAIDKNIDLEHWGRKLGALRAGEVLAVPVEKCVSEWALIKRLNRKLRLEGLTLKKYSGQRWFTVMGNYFTVNDRNVITGSHIDLEDWGRDYGCLCSNELLAVA